VLPFVLRDLAPERLGRPLDLFRLDGKSGQRGEERAALGEALTSAAAVPTMRVTAGESEAPSTPKPRSRGQNPCRQAAQW